MLDLLSNTQIELELGKRLRAERLERNLTQDEVAGRSGLSRRTITAIENGEGSSLSSLVALLRALGALSTLENFLPPRGPSPIALSRLREEPVRHHASKPRKPPAATPWKWGDER